MGKPAWHCTCLLDVSSQSQMIRSRYECQKRKVLTHCRKIVSDGAEVKCTRRLFRRLAAETGKVHLPTVVRLRDGTTSLSEFSDQSLD